MDIPPEVLEQTQARFVRRDPERTEVQERLSVGGPLAADTEARVEARLIALACSSPPEGRSRWTMKLLADKLVELEVVESISDETVRVALKKTSCSRTARSSGASRRRPTPSS